MRPYLINIGTYNSHAQRYLDSIPKLEGGVDRVYVDVKPFIPEEPRDSGTCRYIKCDQGWGGELPGMLRWSKIPMDLDEDRFWIFTDTHDVVCQRPVPDLERFGCDIIVSSEGCTHEKNSGWPIFLRRHSPEFDYLLPRTIYSLGVWAIRGRLAKELISFILSRVTSPDYFDQILFNMWLMDKKFIDSRELSATLCNNYYYGDVIKRGNVFSWKDGTVPAFVHACGPSRSLLC